MMHRIGKRSDRRTFLAGRPPRSPGRPIRAGVIFLAIWSGYFHLAGPCPAADIDAANEWRRLVQRLGRPSPVASDRRQIRDHLDRLAAAAGVNFFFEPGADPTTPVDCQPGTVGGQMVDAVRQAELILHPTADILLVGRRHWCDVMATLVATAPKDQMRIRLWQRDATTPAEAVAAVRPSQSTDRYRHDLWPALRWRQMPRQTAWRLIHAQTQPVRRLPPVYVDRYPDVWFDGIHSASLDHRVDPEGGWIAVRASADQHRDLILGRLVAEGENPPTDRTNQRYTLNAEAGVEAILRKLAEASGVSIRWSADEDAKRRRINLSVTQQTLDEVLQEISASSGLKIRLDAETITVELATPSSGES